MPKRLAIIRGLEAALNHVSDPAALASGAKDWIHEMSAAGVFTDAVKNELFTHVDETVRAIRAGESPPVWSDEP